MHAKFVNLHFLNKEQKAFNMDAWLPTKVTSAFAQVIQSHIGASTRSNIESALLAWVGES